MDARCRRLRFQPGAPSSDNNTGKYRENSPRGLWRRQTERESGRVIPKKISDAERLRGNDIFFPQKYPLRLPGPDDDGDVVCVGGLAICWMLSSYWDCSLPNPRP